jgi:type VI secretion system FHA domain protein
MFPSMSSERCGWVGWGGTLSPLRIVNTELMNLTLEVVSANGAGMGARRRKVFGPEGGAIGRSPEVDWVLPSPHKYVSRHHASIFSNEAGFYIQAVADKPVGINDPKSLLPPDAPYLIKNGDRIYIDEYQILATVEAPPSLERLFSGAGRAHAIAAPSALIPIDAVGMEGDSVDPLDFLGGAGRSASPPPLPPMASPSALHDAMIFPPTRRVESAPLPPNTIPPDWNVTSFTPAESRPAESLRAPPQPEPPRPRPQLGVRPEPIPALQPDRRRAAAPVVPAATAGPAPAVPVGQRATERPIAPQQPASSNLDLTALLRAAGVDPATVPPETVEVFGKILKVAVQGTIDTLRARDEMKSQFRLPVTRVRQTDNNPLSFVVDADEAINVLLSRRSPAYLGPVEAFQRAYDDIRAHQVALLVGMRAGVESLMKQLDPKELAEDFDKQAKRGRLLGASPRSKYWELYEAHFDQLRGDRDDAFRRLFGEEFAEAYERQIAALKAKRTGKGD